MNDVIGTTPGPKTSTGKIEKYKLRQHVRKLKDGG
jgi:hypothetical protein